MTKSNQHLISMIEANEPSLSSYLKANPDIELYFDGGRRYSLLFYAITCNRKITTIKSLIDDQRFLGLTDIKGQTHLMAAVYENNLAAIELILEQDPACLQQLDHQHQNALHYATKPQAVQYLLHQGIDYTIINHEGKTALDKMKHNNLLEAAQAYELFLLQQHLSSDLPIQNNHLSSPKL